MIQSKKQKGMLYSIMMLTIVLSIIGLNAALHESINDFSVQESTIASIGKQQENSIYRSIVSIYKEGYSKEVIERSLPFNYSINGEEVSFTKNYPTNQDLFSETKNILNLSKVFLTDTNYENAFDGAIIDINIPTLQEWAQNKNEVEIRIDPFCYAYKTDETSFQLKKSLSQSCSLPFSSNNLKKVIIDVNLNSTTSDYNQINCTGLLCNDAGYNPSDSTTYVEINVYQSQCPNCSISLTKISQQIDFANQFSVTISCVGASCTGKPITITQDNYDYNVATLEEGVIISGKVVFNEKINDLRVEGIQTRVSLGDIILEKE